jgi:hypothetical protein
MCKYVRFERVMKCALMRLVITFKDTYLEQLSPFSLF